MNLQTNTSLGRIWRDFKQNNPRVRIREAATRLHVSEAELVATGCGDTATPLTQEWSRIIQRVYSLGTVMALTRNDYAVHEVTGPYPVSRINDQQAFIQGPALDLQLWLGAWRYGFAVKEKTAVGIRQSLQFFDASGHAVHKIYMTDTSDYDAYDALVETFRASEPLPYLSQPAEATAKFSLSELEWPFAECERTAQVSFSLFRGLMKKIADFRLPIAIQVENGGAVQIYTGEINRLSITRPWFNVLDPLFSLHLNERKVAGIGLLRETESTTARTALEIQDKENRRLALLYSPLRNNQVEQPLWCELVAGLLTIE